MAFRSSILCDGAERPPDRQPRHHGQFLAEFERVTESPTVLWFSFSSVSPSPARRAPSRIRRRARARASLMLARTAEHRRGEHEVNLPGPEQLVGSERRHVRVGAAHEEPARIAGAEHVGDAGRGRCGLAGRCVRPSTQGT
jgi:hypothetical protein